MQIKKTTKPNSGYTKYLTNKVTKKYWYYIIFINIFYHLIHLLLYFYKKREVCDYTHTSTIIYFSANYFAK